MARLIFLCCAFLLCGGVQAQDIITTISGDTIYCKVDSYNETFIYYRSASTKRGEQDVISRKEVKDINYNAYAPEEKLGHLYKVSSRTYDQISLSAGFGYARWQSETSEAGDLQPYYDKLSNGQFFFIKAGYMLSEYFGLSLTYNRSTFSNSTAVVYVPTGQTGELRDDVRMDYFGVSADINLLRKSEGSPLFMHAGLGYNLYTNDGEVLYGYAINGGGVGLHLGLSYALELGAGVYVPVSLGLIGLQVEAATLEVDADMPDDFESDFRASFEAGLPFGITRFQAGAGLLLTF